MSRWRKGRDSGGGRAADEQAELEALVESEERAAANRAVAIQNETGK